MACLTNTFVITKGFDNIFDFTVKANNSTLPITIDPTDTFSAKLIKLDDGTVALTKTLQPVDVNSGMVRLTITTTETQTLVSEKGDKVDNYYLKPTYKLILDCNTVANGAFITKVDNVYVD